MGLRALENTEPVEVPDGATESAEFQIPDWAASVGVLVPDDVGRSTINLQAALTSGGDFVNIVHFGTLRKAAGRSGYFDLTDVVKGVNSGWFFRLKFNRTQTGPYDVIVSYRGG